MSKLGNKTNLEYYSGRFTIPAPSGPQYKADTTLRTADNAIMTADYTIG